MHKKENFFVGIANIISSEKDVKPQSHFAFRRSFMQYPATWRIVTSEADQWGPGWNDP